MDVPVAEDHVFAMLDPHQISTLNAVERMGATLSLFGIMLIFITFAFFKRLRTIPNTFIFFASVANVGACVACLIAYDGIQAMVRDRNSALCQAQGFLFEWFMQSDPWWSFAMAVNVYMVFFMSFNPTTFRQYLWIYCVICFGLPSIPAFVFLFVREDRGLVYGDAALWCWISSDWNVLRIYSYYLPIWICTVLSAIIYFAIGYHVFHQRNQLRNLSLSNQAKDDDDVICESSDVRYSAEKNLTAHPGPGYYGTVTTEVQVTTASILPTHHTYPTPFLSPPGTPHRASDPRRPSDATTIQLKPTNDTTLRPAMPMPPNAPGGMSPVHTHYYPWSREPSSFSTGGDSGVISPATTLVNSNDSTHGYPWASAAPPHGRGKPYTAHSFEHTGFNGATQCTSISAGSTTADDRDISPSGMPSPMTTMVTHPSPPAGGDSPVSPTDKKASKRRCGPNIFQRLGRAAGKFSTKLRHMDPVKLAYLRTSFVFAISVLVTWTPSSINRVYTLIYPDRASWGLNIAAAVVLPLQGVWNAVIYFTTSWKIFREEVETTRFGRRVLEWLRIDSRAVLARRVGSGSYGLGSSVMTPRSEMGRKRRLEGDSLYEDDVEMVSPVRTQRPRPVQRGSTIRVMKQGLEDFA
ncbi:Cyclic AMP receptor-like protein A [Cytospora mali]|uniref:Cyclic AMP receptor-like protein A n=1 Tax=Cytospora mali TaxID=578113 RepID=A0A194V279_CYTMA|nr:Cyclic AMP receptor-like protein A [Valsa mali var. pyri (nom. inval.)]